MSGLPANFDERKRR